MSAAHLSRQPNQPSSRGRLIPRPVVLVPVLTVALVVTDVAPPPPPLEGRRWSGVVDLSRGRFLTAETGLCSRRRRSSGRWRPRGADVIAAGPDAVAWPQQRMRGARRVCRVGASRRQSGGRPTRRGRYRQNCAARLPGCSQRGLSDSQGGRHRVGDGAAVRLGAPALETATRRPGAPAGTAARGTGDSLRPERRRPARSLLRGAGPSEPALRARRGATGGVPRR